MKILKKLRGKKEIEGLKEWLLHSVIPENPTRKQKKQMKLKIQLIEEKQKSRQIKLDDKKREIAFKESSIPPLEQEVESYEIEREEQKESVLVGWEEREKALQAQIRCLGRKRKLFLTGEILLIGFIVFLGAFSLLKQLDELEQKRVNTIETIKTVDEPKAKGKLEKALKEHQEELEELEKERQEVTDKQESLQKEYENLISIEN